MKAFTVSQFSNYPLMWMFTTEVLKTESIKYIRALAFMMAALT